MRKIYLLLLFCCSFFAANSQSYLSESFESEFTPNTATGPNAPSGWTQTRLGTLAGVPGTPGASGQRDWARSVWSGTAWASNTAPNVNQIPYNSATNGPSGAQLGTGALWFNDGWAAGSGNNGLNLRRIETPSIDLATSTNPIIIFFHSQNTSTAGLTLLGSIDGGTTWNTLATYGSTTNWSWVQRIVALPAIYKIANAKFALQVSNTWGSFDVFIDNFNIQEPPTAASIISTTQGGLWSSTATWAGGVLPTAFDNVTVANGATVTIDGVYSVNNLTIGQGTSGVLNWNGTSNALSATGNITVATGARLLAHTPGGAGQTINVGGNFTNNGYVNLAVGTTAGAGALLNFNGSQVAGGSLSQTLGGTGTFQGNGTSGIIRALFFQTTGSSTISTTQNLITTSFAHTAGSLNTNGRLSIDNTATVYGQTFNTQVSNVAVTNMGTAYANAPVAFGAAVTLWTVGGSATLNTRYFSGNNVYIATTAGTFDATTAPTHTSGIVNNGTVPLLWLGTLGTIGNPFIQTAVTVGTQYFYGNNLYVCTVAGTPSASTPPVHTTGAVASGTATFLYVGSPATVSVNYDATAQNVRSLNLTNAGSGYSGAPSISFSLNGGTVTTAAAASTTVFQSVAYGANSLTQASGGATITGALTINSTAGASAFSGVGSVFTTSGGVGYTVAPTVGFSGPTNINLVTNGGSGYTTAPTITVTGGTLISGTALTSTNFTITVAGGSVVSAYLNTGTTALYSVPPTLAFSAGTATLAFPAGCWPTATAVIGSNGQITNFTLINAGFGYVAAPTVGFGATSGTPTGGTFITAATAPTARVALYNITYGFFTPAATNIQNTNAVFLPSNGKMNTITINSAMGASIASNLELFSATPFTLTAGVLDFGANTVSCTNHSYAGASGSATSSVLGRILLTTPGGSVTRTFPYDVPLAVATGTGSLATGATITTLTATRTAAPSGSVSGGVANITGSRAYRVQASASSTYGTNPTVTMNYNATDALSTVNNADLLITQSAALTGAWRVRSLSSGTGALSATGSRTTATSGVGPIVPTGDDYFAWATSLPCTGTPTTGVITGASDACVGGTITFSSSVFSAGNGMTYRWQTSTTGSDPWTNTTSTTPGSYSFTFATPIWVRRVDTCTNGNAFAVSNAIQVSARATTLCYCGPNTGVVIHSSITNAIDNVTITGTTLNNSNAGLGNLSTGYTEFPSTGSSTATLFQGTSYSLTTTLASSGSLASVWIDYNQNGTYEASEWTDITRSSPSANAVVTATINIPLTASLGLTGMRIRTRSATPNGDINACTSFGSGETEEYYITIAAPAACSGTPTAGTVTGPSSAVCAGVNFTLTAAGFTNGLAGLTYRWQSSPDNTTWTNTTGTTPASFTTNVTSSTWFRLVDTCTNGNAFGVSNAVQVTVNSAVYATLPYAESFENTWIDGCGAVGSRSIPNNSWRNNPTTGNNSWRRNDEITANSGWSNTSGAYSPTFSDGAFSARIHTFNTTASGNLDVYLNCSSGAITKQLTYDYINTSGSDSLKVFLSLDGGSNFTFIGTRNTTTTTWSTFVVPFTSSSATTVLRFTAYGDAGSTDIGLDKVIVTSVSCGSPTSVNSSSVTTTSASINWTAPAGGTVTNYYWELRTSGAAASGSLGLVNSGTTATTGVNLSSLVSGTAYQFFVKTNCINPDTSAYSGINFNTLLVNDDCTTATPVSQYNGTINVSTIGASQSLAPVTCNSFTATNAFDVWYSFTTSQTGSVTISTAGLDVVIQAFSGTCGALTSLSCADVGGTTETLTLTGLLASTTYYFRIYAYVGTGTFTLNLSGAALPVTITSFKGERQGANNLLSWTTATEVNNAGFELQRSADGINFSKLAYVETKANNGNSSQALTYNFTDVKPLSIAGYYRLKQIDKDGKTTLSEVVLIKGIKPSKLELVSVFPNPVISTLNVGIAAVKADRVTFIVSDITGKTIISKVMNVVSGDNLLPINVANLANGTYTVKAICADGCETAIKKFVKQ